MQIGICLFNYHNGWEMHSCDIEATFLEPTMDNVMYIETAFNTADIGMKKVEKHLFMKYAHELIMVCIC